MPGFSVETTQSGFLMMKNNFLQVIDIVLQQFLQAGKINFLITNGYKQVIVKEPVMLTLKDLIFLFIIWLGFCGISVAAFIVEVLYAILKSMQKKAKMMKSKPAKVQRVFKHN